MTQSRFPQALTPTYRNSFYVRFGKRCCDIATSLIALPAVGLATLFIGIAIKLEDGGPVFFRQTRRGKNGREFTLLKFRSMRVNAPDLRQADNSTLASAHDPRVTRVGRIIRRTSLDELPQLFNVLKGDMSIIGPRPNLATRPLSELRGDELRRLGVRPGITGYNQAFYRNSSTLADRYRHDCYYVDNVSFTTDIRILGVTAVSVILGRNIYSMAHFENLAVTTECDPPLQ